MWYDINSVAPCLLLADCWTCPLARTACWFINAITEGDLILDLNESDAFPNLLPLRVKNIWMHLLLLFISK